MEQEILEQHAARLGVDLGDLPDIGEDISSLPWPTRVLVYRDAYMLALADGFSSSEEKQHLEDLSKRMDLPTDTTDTIHLWVSDYGSLLDRFDDILRRGDE